MPIIKIKKTKEYIYGIWKITENNENLLQKLNPNNEELSQLKKISHLERKAQSISAKLILNELAKQKITVLYQNNIPYCNKYSNISISHSGQYSVALISKKNIGIDLQMYSEKLNKIKNKFINTDEKKNNPSLNDIHKIWTAKEAIYKALKGEKCSFKKNIFLDHELKNGYYQLGPTNILFDLETIKMNNLYLSIAIQRSK